MKEETQFQNSSEKNRDKNTIHDSNNQMQPGMRRTNPSLKGNQKQESEIINDGPSLENV